MMMRNNTKTINTMTMNTNTNNTNAGKKNNINTTMIMEYEEYDEGK